MIPFPTWGSCHSRFFKQKYEPLSTYSFASVSELKSVKRKMLLTFSPAGVYPSTVDIIAGLPAYAAYISTVFPLWSLSRILLLMKLVSFGHDPSEASFCRTLHQMAKKK